MKHTAEAHLDATVETGAGAKVGAKAKAHFNVLGDLSEPSFVPPGYTLNAPIWPAMSRRSNVPKKRGRR